MGDAAITENKESADLETQRLLNVTRKKDIAAAEKKRGMESGLPSEEAKKGWKAALINMYLFDGVGDILGAFPFIGGIVRFITGVGAVIQSFKINPAVRVTAWVINGVTALIDICLSFIGLNFLPTQTIGAAIIGVIASNAEQEKTEQPR